MSLQLPSYQGLIRSIHQRNHLRWTGADRIKIQDYVLLENKHLDE